MALKSNRKEQDDPKLDMTPMIDVVFQLMIFFVVTLKQEDIYSMLLANAPAPNSSSTPDETAPEPVKIDVGPVETSGSYAGKYALSKKRITLIGISFSSEKRTIVEELVEELPTPRT